MRVTLTNRATGRVVDHDPALSVAMVNHKGREGFWVALSPMDAIVYPLAEWTIDVRPHGNTGAPER